MRRGFFGSASNRESHGKDNGNELENGAVHEL